MYLLKRGKTHYLSRFELTNPDFDTVMSISHSKADQLAPVYDIQNKDYPMWMEVVHSSNLLNKVNLDATLLETFDFDFFR